MTAITPALIEQVRRMRPAHTLRQIAEATGVSVTRLKRLAARHRIYRRVPRGFSPAEDAVLRQRYGDWTLAEIGRHLGRTPTAVWNRAHRLGLPLYRPRPSADLDAAIRRDFAAGRSDAQIAAEHGCSPMTIWEHRRKMGLRRSDAQVHALRVANVREGLRRFRLRGGGSEHPRTSAHRRYARRHGWPEDLRPRQVQILDVIWRDGPMTARQIGVAIGLPRPTSRYGLSSSRHNYLTGLIRRGLLVKMGRVARDPDTNHPVCVYSIPITVTCNRQEGSDAQTP